ncbi:hypothetical protein [Streptomyces sp. NPDC127084]|uniref:hypothetical protein n=1 Tax=Streptomyces sp. NPDC127084 TaxID=3347133 RepID=UPI003660DF52
MKRIFAVLAACAAVVLASGCGASDSSPKPNASNERNPVLHASRVKDYNSFAELKRDSVAAVSVTAVKSTVGSLNGVATTTVEVKVEKVLWGKLNEVSISVLQLGKAGWGLEDSGAILEEGQRYVLFVHPYHLKPNDDTGLYVITGGQGAYKLDGEYSEYNFAGGGHPRLPEEVSVKDFRAHILNEQ